MRIVQYIMISSLFIIHVLIYPSMCTFYPMDACTYNIIKHSIQSSVDLKYELCLDRIEEVIEDINSFNSINNYIKTNITILGNNRYLLFRNRKTAKIIIKNNLYNILLSVECLSEDISQDTGPYRAHGHGDSTRFNTPLVRVHGFIGINPISKKNMYKIIKITDLFPNKEIINRYSVLTLPDIEAKIFLSIDNITEFSVCINTLKRSMVYICTKYTEEDKISVIKSYYNIIKTFNSYRMLEALNIKKIKDLWTCTNIAEKEMKKFIKLNPDSKNFEKTKFILKNLEIFQLDIQIMSTANIIAINTCDAIKNTIDQIKIEVNALDLVISKEFQVIMNITVKLNNYTTNLIKNWNIYCFDSKVLYNIEISLNTTINAYFTLIQKYDALFIDKFNELKKKIFKLKEEQNIKENSLLVSRHISYLQCILDYLSVCKKKSSLFLNEIEKKLIN
ncbi:uncharacterized protein NEPG_01085 [Nematocida parisii ERTm1]|uniref:Uncharacterized protein n=1 Tax=Nematocida parisii (strain ERTm3) TaxID=935791 RepID=I3EJI8_NEMP3|nr:uncharacterized protein NEPG_01085 [Nematocida parisii ERTm1]EIJ89385.1 hypothetical protein NEQG_00155 [Nematocida parisii ERTm3]EIJ94417.1 hypothetical protein NEPG_01085 [Nematocida parisii ERTm1]|eukprot:XP_013058913.1 hypothetical protein NEPG_01085 [Nematocida parisii ERTm1]